MHDSNPLVFPGLNEAFLSLTQTVLNEGTAVRNLRTNSSIMELTGNVIHIDDPLGRHLTVRGRNNNPFAAIVETMWVLAGKNDIATILPYLPRAADFSDDGETWRAGYGPRIRDFHGVDQVKSVIETLKADPTSRRAVISIFDPTVDHDQKTKDTPCNNWLHFLQRDNMLDLCISVRSNDLIWGFSGINFFEWSVLQQFVAENLSTEDDPVYVGQQKWLQGSLHMYDHHAEIFTARPMSYAGYFGQGQVATYFPLGLDVDTMDEQLSEWFRHLQDYENGNTSYVPVLDNLMNLYLWLLRGYWMWRHGKKSGFRKFLKELCSSYQGMDIVPAMLLFFEWKKAIPAEFERQAFTEFAALEDPRSWWYRDNVMSDHTLVDVPASEETHTVTPGDARGVGQGTADVIFSFYPIVAVDSSRNTTSYTPPSEGTGIAGLSDHLQYLADLHMEKELVYKGSWCRHGEVMSILPNILRKTDRLEAFLTLNDAEKKASEGTESVKETLSDLLVYSYKYLDFSHRRLNGEDVTPEALSSPEVLEKVNRGILLGIDELLVEQGTSVESAPFGYHIKGILDTVDALKESLEKGISDAERMNLVLYLVRGTLRALRHYFVD